jgi:hypothetical protein
MFKLEAEGSKPVESEMFGYKWPISVPKSQVTKNKRTMHQKNHLIV